MTLIQKIIRSKAVWTSFLSFAGVIVMYYTSVPEAIWQSFILFALSLVAIFAIDEGAETFGRTLARGLRGQDKEE